MSSGTPLGCCDLDGRADMIENDKRQKRVTSGVKIKERYRGSITPV